MLGVVMGRIDPNGAGRTGRAQWVRSAALVALTLVVAACGNDPGGPFVMPAGEEFDAFAADRVLVVVESQNECASLGACVPKLESPCDLGDGNERGLAVYRLGTSGRLVSATGDQAGALPEAIIPTGDNPRRVIAHPNDPTLLYVATLSRVQVFRLMPSGGSVCIDETFTDLEIDSEVDPEDDLDPFDLVIDPNFGTFGVLYVAANGVGRIDAYDIAADGTLPPLPSSCIVGSSSAEFAAVSPVNSTLFATGSRDRIEVYERRDGQFLDAQVATPTPTSTPGPDELTPTPTGTPAPTGPTPVATPSPAPTCIDPRFVTRQLSSLGAGRVTAMDFLPAEEPNDETVGDLVVAEEGSLSLISFPIDPNGQLDGDDNGSTSRAGFYTRILRVDRNGATFYYTTAFQEGKTDVYKLGDPSEDADRLSGDPLSKTRSDPFSLPVGLAIDGDTGPMLFVAQEGLGRVDGFRIRADGSTDQVPATSTAPAQGIDGQTLELFPNDVLIVPLP